MQSNLTEMKIQIPAALGERVEESLIEVKRIHRGKIIKRASAAFGGFAVAVGAFFLLGYTNPALAAQIPLLGRIFQQVNTDSKTFGPANLDSYGVTISANTAAESTNENCGLTLISAYSDGNTAQLSFRLDLNGELQDRYAWIDTQYGGASSVLINGVRAEKMQMNFFEKTEGIWLSTMNITLPEEAKTADVLQLDLRLAGFNGQFDNVQSEPIDGEFTLSYALPVDREHSRSFSGEAEDNGAKATAISITPTQLVISIVKPYWGELGSGGNLTDPDVYPMGFPHLYTESGEEIRRNANATIDEGGYDMYARQEQTADLYFDAPPAGTKRLILRFEVGEGNQDALAEFTIDLENQTIEKRAANGDPVFHKIGADRNTA